MIFVLLLSTLSAAVFAQTISFISVPNNYTAGSIQLSAPFTNAITATSDPDVIYASVGSYGFNKVVKVQISTGTCTDVTDAVFGSIGGMTVLSTGELIIIENSDNVVTTTPGECILLAKDLNSDGDFMDSGEIDKLIDPILAEASWGGFSGAQARTVPSGNPGNIPSGSLAFMDSDALNKGDLFVVTNPTTSSLAAYYPPSSSFFRGFDYNGGFDFASDGVIYLGATTDDFHGTIFALKNLNGNNKIDNLEYNDVVSTYSLMYTSVSDVIIDNSDNVYFTAMSAPNPLIKTFPVLPDPLTSEAAFTDFASFNAGWISAIALNSKSLSFKPDTNTAHATMIIGGTTTSWLSATNLLTLTPRDISSVNDWNLFE